MKAIIPVAGAGVRLRPHTYTQPKPLILVAGKPIISFIIDQLLEAGIEEFVFVLGYLGDKIKSYLETAYPALSKEYVYQEHRNGLGHAILMTEKAVRDTEEIVILLGDTILEIDMKDFLGQKGSCLGIQRVQDPRLFGVVEMATGGIVKKVIEKPKIPKSNLAIVGLYKISQVHELMFALKEIREEKKDTDQEIQLTEGLMRMIEKGCEFTTFEVQKWYDCGRKDILLETNRVLLEQLVTDVGTQYVYDHSILIPPVVYGKSCTFVNSIIGPNITLGDHVRVEGSILTHSIVGNYVEIKHAVLSKSIIGNDAIIRGQSQSLNIGDNNEIDFAQ